LQALAEPSTADPAVTNHYRREIIPAAWRLVLKFAAKDTGSLGDAASLTVLISPGRSRLPEN
jgi:hypothetical protein